LIGNDGKTKFGFVFGLVIFFCYESPPESRTPEVEETGGQAIIAESGLSNL
jgi:hypothetical protein